MSQVLDWWYIDLTTMLCKQWYCRFHKCLVSNSTDLCSKYKTNLKQVTCHSRLPTHSAWSNYNSWSKLRKKIKSKQDTSRSEPCLLQVCVSKHLRYGTMSVRYNNTFPSEKAGIIQFSNESMIIVWYIDAV